MDSIHFKVPRQSEDTIRVERWDLPHFYDPIHFHYECQLTYILASEGILFVNGSMVRFQEGDLYLIGENQPHVFMNDDLYYKNQPELRAKALSIFFPRDPIMQMVNKIPEGKTVYDILEKSDNGLKIEYVRHSELHVLVNRVLTETSLPRVLCLIKILYLLSKYGSLKMLSTQTSVNINKEDSDRLDKVFEYLINNYNTEVSLKEVAALINLTPTSFCRYFKSRTQKSFFRLLAEVRIRKVCKMLVDNNVNVSEAAYWSGYNNMSNFHRHFKSITGFTPTEYRKRIMRQTSVEIDS